MAYKEDIYIFPGSIEHEYKYNGKYGAKGEKRQPRREVTKEQIKKQNQWNREKTVRHLIKNNFGEYDLWITLKYPKGKRKPLIEIERDLQNFVKRLRYALKKQDAELKYVIRYEIGRRGGIHIHFLANRIEGKPGMDVLIRQLWTHGGVHFELLYEKGGYRELARYIVKLPDEDIEKQLSMFPEAERKKLIRYSCSRNLKRIKPITKEYRHWTMRKILEQGPTPTEGYYIDKDSIICGVNPVTGKNYLYYTEYPLTRGRGKPPDG